MHSGSSMNVSFPAMLDSEAHQEVTLECAPPTLLLSLKIQLPLFPPPPPSCWPSYKSPRAHGRRWVRTEDTAGSLHGSRKQLGQDSTQMGIQNLWVPLAVTQNCFSSQPVGASVICQRDLSGAGLLDYCSCCLFPPPPRSISGMQTLFPLRRLPTRRLVLGSDFSRSFLFIPHCQPMREVASLFPFCF